MHWSAKVACCLAGTLLSGCGTTRFTDTARSATEMLLISKAVDDTMADIDFRSLTGKTVFLEEKYLDGIQDKGYLISSLRQHLLASGALLQEEKSKATYVVEARAGVVATDRTSLLVGIPQITLPTVAVSTVPIPNSIPEIPFAKSTEQRAYAKVAVFAYNRLTGRPVMQSGLAKAHANSKDLWVCGLGPFQGGTIRDKTEFNGSPVSIPFFGHGDEEEPVFTLIDIHQPAAWTENASLANRDVRPAEPKAVEAKAVDPKAAPSTLAPPGSQFAAERPAEAPLATGIPDQFKSPVLPATFLPKKPD